MESICKYNKPDCYGAKELEFLLELSSLLSNKDINLDDVMSLLANHLSAERIILTILNRENSNIVIEGTFGITEKEDKVTKSVSPESSISVQVPEKENISDSQRLESQEIKPAPQTLDNTESKIKRIVWFFENGKFESFEP